MSLEPFPGKDGSVLTAAAVGSRLCTVVQEVVCFIGLSQTCVHEEFHWTCSTRFGQAVTGTLLSKDSLEI